MIQGKRIALRMARAEERGLIYQMGHSTDYMRQCFADTFENGLESFNQNYILEYFDGREPYVRGGMMICLDTTPIGFISYGQINNFTDRDWVCHFGTMELDIWLNGEENCGRGYGIDAITTLTDHLHQAYNISRFMICPERINPRAIHAYRKAGFAQVAPADKPQLLREIFGRHGLSQLKPDDAYFSDAICFMFKRYQ